MKIQDHTQIFFVESTPQEDQHLCLLQGKDAISTDCSVELVETSTGNVSVCICKDKRNINSSAAKNESTTFIILILISKMVFS